VRVRVEVVGDIDADALWPWSGAVEPGAATSVVVLELHDGRELVSALSSLSRRGITVVSAERVSAA
jgi:hypothetical protein